MKILIVNTLYPPEIVGGAEISVSLLAEALSRRGHAVCVVCLYNGRTQSVAYENGIRVYRVPLDNDYWPFGQTEKRPGVQRLLWHLKDAWNFKAAVRFGEILDIEKPDLLHTNNLAGFSVSLWFEAKRRNIRVLHNLRDYSLVCKRSTLFRNGSTCKKRCPSCVAMTLPNLLASRLVDAVVSSSQFVLNQHKRVGFFSLIPSKVIFNIAEATFGANALPSHHGDLTFGFIGRLEVEKGIEVVLKAAKLLPREGWRLRIAGKGQEPYVSALKAQYNMKNVEWLGFAERSDFYAGIDVCLVSSVWPEPLPRILIESIAAGRATICSTAGGIPEISGFSHLIDTYQPNDHQRLSELMLKAIKEKARWTAPQSVKPGFAENFSPESIARQHSEIWKVETRR